MGCNLSSIGALYDVAVSSSGRRVEISLKGRRFRVIKTLGEGGFSFVYLVKEVESESSTNGTEDLEQAPMARGSSGTGDGLYAVKKVLIQSKEQLTAVKAEVEAAKRFSHPNLLPLLDHCYVSAPGKSADGKKQTDGALSGRGEALLLFPVHQEGSLQEKLQLSLGRSDSAAASSGSAGAAQHLPAYDVLHIFSQVCAGILHMHSCDPPYAHNDIKPANVLLSRTNNRFHAVLTDFGSVTLANRQIRSRQEALALQEWAAVHCTAPYRAPELWDCPSNCDIDARTDVWALGCVLFAIMYGESPFEYCLGETGGSLQLATMSAHVKWPAPAAPPYPKSLHDMVLWLLQPEISIRPTCADVCTHVQKLLATLPPSPLRPDRI